MMDDRFMSLKFEWLGDIKRGKCSLDVLACV